MTDIQLLFLDEPTSGLDPISAREFDHLLRTLCDSLGLTAFLTTHDLDTLWGLVDRVIVLYGGRVIADGPVAEVDKEPQNGYDPTFPPIPEHVMEAEARYAWIGVAVLALIALLAAGLYWLTGGLERQSVKRYVVYFHNQSLEGMQINSDVRMQGIKVGKVTDYAIMPGEARKVRVLLITGYGKITSLYCARRSASVWARWTKSTGTFVLEEGAMNAEQRIALEASRFALRSAIRRRPLPAADEVRERVVDDGHLGARRARLEEERLVAIDEAGHGPGHPGTIRDRPVEVIQPEAAGLYPELIGYHA